MKLPFRALCYSLLLAAPLTLNADGDLITDGYFQNLTYSGSKTLTTLFGQFGTGTGSTLQLDNWSTSGYNFVYAPGTADSGTTAGANTTPTVQPNEAPGQYNASNGYGNTYLWGTNNGGLAGITAYPGPANENFIAADGAFQVKAITQSINNLTAGQTYGLNFYWAAGQQQNYSGATTEAWTVSLGSQTFSTATYNLTNHSFSGWMAQTFYFTPTTSTATLSFLAVGTPSGLPPFVLLGGVSMYSVPEPSVWGFCMGLGAAAVGLGVVRRRRQARLAAQGD